MVRGVRLGRIIRETPKAVLVEWSGNILGKRVTVLRWVPKTIIQDGIVPWSLSSVARGRGWAVPAQTWDLAEGAEVLLDDKPLPVTLAGGPRIALARQVLEMYEVTGGR